jgi:hypothetical protein
MVVSWIWITKPSTTFWPRNWACGHLDAASRLRSQSHRHLCERRFDQKGHSSGSEVPIQARSDSVTSFFSRNSNSNSKVVILVLWTTSKRSWQTAWGHFHMKTSSTATGSDNVSDGVWLPKGTTLKGMMFIFSSVLFRFQLDVRIYLFIEKCEGAPTNTWPNGITHQNQYTHLWFAKYVWSSWRWA